MLASFAKSFSAWMVKRFLTVDTIKTVVRKANAKLAEKVRIESDERKKVIATAGEIGDVAALYLKGYSNDGALDEAETEAINEAELALIDKYIDKDVLDGIVDSLLK